MKITITKKRKKDNRGMSLVMVISAVALVSILVMVLLSVSLMNMQMKAVYRESVDNFYDAEAAMDEIRTGLQQEVSLAATESYVTVMEAYSGTAYQNEMRRNLFRSHYRSKLKNRLGQAADPSQYDIGRLKNYIGAEHRYKPENGQGADLHTASGKSPRLEVTAAGLVLCDLELVYRDEQNNVSLVKTDIVLAYPEINFIQPMSVADLLSYCMVADDGVTVDNGNRTLILEGNVYAGDYGTTGNGGFTVANSGTVSVAERMQLILQGGLNVRENGSFTTGDRTLLWADNLEVESNSELLLSGTAYVADDLTVTGSGSVTLQGEYYGYGNPNSAKLASSVDVDLVNQDEAAYSSAILINGLADSGRASIHMNGLTKLMLAGNAYIGSGRAMMGESLAVKSSQIAYLAPEDCFTVETSNPTTDILTQLQEEDYLDYDALSRYHATGVVRQVSPDGMVYYFLEFQNAAEAAAYDAEYFADKDHAQERERYLGLYVDDQELTLRESSTADKSINGSILIWDRRGVRAIEPEFAGGETDLSDNVYYARIQAGWQDMYSAYNRNLTSDYVLLTAEQRNATVFENLVDVGALQSLVSAGDRIEYRYTDGAGDVYSAFAVNNPAGVFTVDQAFLSGKHVPLIIATGDVRVTTDYSGIILSGGRIFCDNIQNGSVTVRADREAAADVILQAQYDAAGTTYSLHELLKGYEYYIGSVATSGDEGTIDITKMVIYTNWSKE